jgi:hypothetical protein
VECDSKKMEQLTGMLKREVAAINLATYESGGEVPPPTPMSATASFGKSNVLNAISVVVIPIKVKVSRKTKETVRT